MAALCAGQAVGPFPLYGDDFAHDPSTLIKDGASYFIYADGQGITALTSTDRRNWSGASPVFTTNIPAWTTNNISGFTGYFWAPDVACFNGQYPVPVDPNLDKYIMERRAHRTNLLVEEEHPELFDKVF